MASSASWRPLRADLAPEDWHINRLEMRAVQQALQVNAEHARHKRQLYLLDSAVCTGDLAKGWFAAKALNKASRVSLAICLAHFHSPGCQFIRRRANPADNPSRGRPLAPPSGPVPHWQVELEDGITDRFD